MEDSKQDQPVEGSPVDIATASFNPPGSVMDIQADTGQKVRYKLTPQGWQLVEEQ